MKTTFAESKDLTRAQKSRLHELRIVRGSLDLKANVSEQSIWPPHPPFLPLFQCACLLLVVSSPYNLLLVGNVCFTLPGECNLHFKTAPSLHHISCDPSWFLQQKCLCMFVRGCLLACVNPAESARVGGCYLPQLLSTCLLSWPDETSLELSSEGHSATQWATHLEDSWIKSRIPFSNRVHLEHAQWVTERRVETIIDLGSDECEGNCQNWCDNFLSIATGPASRWGLWGSARHCISPASANRCHVTSA